MKKLILISVFIVFSALPFHSVSAESPQITDKLNLIHMLKYDQTITDSVGKSVSVNGFAEIDINLSVLPAISKADQVLIQYREGSCVPIAPWEHGLVQHGIPGQLISLTLNYLKLNTRYCYQITLLNGNQVLTSIIPNEFTTLSFRLSESEVMNALPELEKAANQRLPQISMPYNSDSSHIQPTTVNQLLELFRNSSN